MNRYTVLGASGFVGGALARVLREGGAQVCTPARGESLAGRELGHVFYCIGMTADFRRWPFHTEIGRAHV